MRPVAPGSFRTSVHPRVCGEHEDDFNKHFPHAGSSPRVRGTSVRRSRLGALLRFIPACAGNIPSASASASESAVHPRVCGEHPRPGWGGPRPVGSSPRVRGTFGCGRLPVAAYRFIPACAGNIDARCRRQRHTPVHPRVCGEHAVRVDVRVGQRGSSPRVRGTSPDRMSSY